MIKEATLEGLLFVALHMRQRDKDEIYALMNTDDGALLVADQAYFNSRFKWVAHRHDVPVAAFGAYQMWGGVWSVWMFATDAFDKGVGKEIVHFGRKHFVPALVSAGAHRVECKSLDVHVEAHAFLEKVGAQKESVAKGLGKNKEDFFVYVWSSPTLCSLLNTCRK